MTVSANHSANWPRATRALHWLTALAVLVEVPAGLAMAWTYAAKDPAGQAIHLRTSQIHHTIGLLLIGVVLARLAWRARTTRPPVLASGAQAALARGVQALLYALMLLVPLSGWAALSVLGAAGGYPAPSLWLFTHDGFGPGGVVPHLLAPRPWNAPGLIRYGTFAAVHRWLLIGGAGLLLAHVGAALVHHFLRRDATLRRMLHRA